MHLTYADYRIHRRHCREPAMTDASEKAVRDTRIKRQDLKESTRVEIWAKAAGRCCICARYMIGDTGYFHSTLVGEVAHLTGATSGDTSPRGRSTADADERARASNLMLLCHDCHKKVDSRGLAGFYTREMLARIKDRHEARVRTTTDFSTYGPAMVLRVSSKIRGTKVAATDRQISEALRQSQLSPATADARDSRFEIDLPDAESTDWGWARADALLEAKATEVLEKARAAGEAAVVVFALGPIPTLALLGYHLDDKADIRLLPATRRDDDSKWLWSAPAFEPPRFELQMPAGDDAVEEIVVTVDITAVASIDKAPSGLRAAPVVRFRSTLHGPQVVETREAFEAFGRDWRLAMARIEEAFPAAKRIHLIAAAPSVVAIEIGRAYMRGSQAELVIYQRTNLEEYIEAVRLK